MVYFSGAIILESLVVEETEYWEHLFSVLGCHSAFISDHCHMKLLEILLESTWSVCFLML